MVRVTDIHSHIFSALCLPLEGILRELADEDGYLELKPLKARAASCSRRASTT